MAVSQTKLVLQHLIEHGTITSYEAIKLYGVTRLSAIIYNLRYNNGYIITTTFENVKTRYGIVTSVARYKLEGGKGVVI